LPVPTHLEARVVVYILEAEINIERAMAVVAPCAAALAVIGETDRMGKELGAMLASELAL
jgi:hypothetical protein